MYNQLQLYYYNYYSTTTTPCLKKCANLSFAPCLSLNNELISTQNRIKIDQLVYFSINSQHEAGYNM